jgi:hypothetical protein
MYCCRKRFGNVWAFRENAELGMQQRAELGLGVPGKVLLIPKDSD